MLPPIGSAQGDKPTVDAQGIRLSQSHSEGIWQRRLTRFGPKTKLVS